MKVVGLVSGGKDSCYNLIECLREGHEIVALANLKPNGKDELDSFMYQTVGHDVIDLYAEATGLPLYRRTITGSSVCQSMMYELDEADEVEDLLMLLKDVQRELSFDAVAVGAILSDYQRIRVENVCHRLGLKSLSYLWRRNQDELLEEMINSGIHAVIIKVAALGLLPKTHLSMSIKEMLTPLRKLNDKFGLNICGEGGEYETMTLDCPIFLRKIVVDETEIVIHSDDAFAPVGYLKFNSMHLEDKGIDPGLSLLERLQLSQFEASRYLSLNLSIDDNISFSEPNIKDSRKGKLIKSVDDGIVQHPVIEPPFIKKVGNYVQISQLTMNYQNTENASSYTRSLLVTLKDLLLQNGCTLADCVLVHLFIKDMTKFAEVNEVYKEFFTSNPPARICIELSLHCPLTINCLAFCHGAGKSSCVSNATERKTLYVQSISRWAPANIGPYSQAVKIGSSIFVCGLIGLVPGSMLVASGGILQQASLSLRHADRILNAVDASCGINDAICVICYLTSAQYLNAAHRMLKESCNASSSPWKGIFQAVVVAGLPRAALIEWGFIAHSCSNKDIIELHSSLAVEERAVIRSKACFCLCEMSGFLSIDISVNDSSQAEINWPTLISNSFEEIQQLVNQYGSCMDKLISLQVFYIGSMNCELPLASCIARQCKSLSGFSNPAISVVKVEHLPNSSSLSIIGRFF